jgi:hypothetical protein
MLFMSYSMHNRMSEAKKEIGADLKIKVLEII